MTASINPAAPHHLPGFITAPGETDTFMVVMAIFLIVVVLAVGILFLRLHTLPERLAHRLAEAAVRDRGGAGASRPVHALHLFWVAGLLLALIDLPDFGTPLRRIAGSLEKIAGLPPGRDGQIKPDETPVASKPGKPSLPASARS